MNKTDEPLVIIGAGGHAKVILDVARRIYPDLKMLFFDDHSNNGKSKAGLRISGTLEDAFSRCFGESRFIIALGDNPTRKFYFQRLVAVQRFVDTLVSIDAHVSPSAVVGGGAVVMPAAVLNADASIGSNVIVNSGAVVEHDCSVADHSHLAPGSILTGGVRVGSLTTIGAGAIVCPGVSIGDGVLLGAGSVATKDILQSGFYCGVPARRQ